MPAAAALREVRAEAILRGMEPFGRILVIVGLTIAALGALLWVGGGRGRGGFLPGDISIEREHFKFYFPIVTCVVVSLILTVLFRLFRK